MGFVIDCARENETSLVGFKPRVVSICTGFHRIKYFSSFPYVTYLYIHIYHFEGKPWRAEEQVAPQPFGSDTVCPKIAVGCYLNSSREQVVENDIVRLEWGRPFVEREDENMPVYRGQTGTSLPYVTSFGDKTRFRLQQGDEALN